MNADHDDTLEAAIARAEKFAKALSEMATPLSAILALLDAGATADEIEQQINEANP
jgi:hypothetical protein